MFGPQFDPCRPESSVPLPPEWEVLTFYSVWRTWPCIVHGMLISGAQHSGTHGLTDLTEYFLPLRLDLGALVLGSCLTHKVAPSPELHGLSFPLSLGLSLASSSSLEEPGSLLSCVFYSTHEGQGAALCRALV